MITSYELKITEDKVQRPKQNRDLKNTYKEVSLLLSYIIEVNLGLAPLSSGTLLLPSLYYVILDVNLISHNQSWLLEPESSSLCYRQKNGGMTKMLHASYL